MLKIIKNIHIPKQSEFVLLKNGTRTAGTLENVDIQ